MKTVAIVFTGGLLLVGCGSVRYPTYYVLNFPSPAPQAREASGALGPVAIREFGCPDYLCGDRIAYRPSSEEVGFYEFHRWAMNPQQAITKYVEDSLRAKSPFRSIAVHERRGETAYVLTGNIERFEEMDQGRDVRAICTISGQLLDAETKSVVWSNTASETVQVDKRDIRGVVNSLSAAARMAADRLLQSMTQQMAAKMALAPTERQEPRY